MRLSKKLQCLILLIVLLASICTAKEGVASERVEEVIVASSHKLLNSLKVDQDLSSQAVLNQWMDYLKSISNYSNSEYIEAIGSLEKEYLDLMAEYEQCLNNSKALRDDFNASWLETMIDHFGVMYLKAKEKSVHDNLGMIIGGAEENCCGANLEKLIFKEIVMYGAYRDYLNRFLSFCRKQSATTQSQLGSRKAVVEEFLKLIDRVSVVKMTLAGGLHRRQLSEIKAKNSDKPIYEYFKANPPGCDIDPFKAMEEFRKAMKSH